MSERKRYCGSSLAFGDCRYAGDALPDCAASKNLWEVCAYRHRGIGKPTEVDDVVVAHGEPVTTEE